MVGTRDVQPPDAAMPRPFRPVWVNVGRPIDVSRYGDRSDDRLLLRQLTDEVMYEIRELSGQEYVDEYATKKPEDIPADGLDRDHGQRRHRRRSTIIGRGPGELIFAFPGCAAFPARGGHAARSGSSQLGSGSTTSPPVAPTRCPSIASAPWP